MFANGSELRKKRTLAVSEFSHTTRRIRAVDTMRSGASVKRVRGLYYVMLLLACASSLRAQAQPIQYYYDDLGRLVTMVDQSGNVVTYTYDAVGNILSIGRSTVAKGQLAIFDFNPKIGPSGMPVTIRGQGFSATATSDIVTFNGTAATVTSATTSTLVTTVPLGATTGPISVTVQGNTVTSSTNFVVVALPIITSVWPKSALFGTTVPDSQVTGVNLVGSTFSFSAAGPTLSLLSISPTGTSASLTFNAGSTAGTYALVATDYYGGNSGTVATAANRFTAVDPSSTADTDNDGYSDVVEASYGTDPLDPASFPTSNTPPLSGQVYGIPFSVLNESGVKPPTQFETDGILFSVLNKSLGTQPIAAESDGILFSVQNNAGGEKTSKKATDKTIHGDDDKRFEGAARQSAIPGTHTNAHP